MERALRGPRGSGIRIRDGSLITGEGVGLQNGSRGACDAQPLLKGGGQKMF